MTNLQLAERAGQIARLMRIIADLRGLDEIIPNTPEVAAWHLSGAIRASETALAVLCEALRVAVREERP